MRKSGKFFAVAGVAMILLLAGAGMHGAGCGVSATSAATCRAADSGTGRGTTRSGFWVSRPGWATRL